jgi:Family of unknown function (DUF6544)
MIILAVIVAISLFSLMFFLLAGTLGRARFQSRVAVEVCTLFSGAAEASLGTEQLAIRYDGLPEPVRRYLHYAISTTAPAIRTARLKHEGFFRTKPGQNWLPITGEEYFTVAVPGFMWNATVRPAPLLWIEARDLLQTGQGNMLVRVNSVVTVSDAKGPELDQGASLRWLVEAIWFPYAFVGDLVRWQPVDDHSARATLVQPGLPVAATFEIDNEGKLTKMWSDRYRDLGKGQSVLTPWFAKCSEYRTFSGFRVPTAVDVAWEIDQQRFSYARFQVTTLEYNVTKKF